MAMPVACVRARLPVLSVWWWIDRQGVVDVRGRRRCIASLCIASLRIGHRASLHERRFRGTE
jgi:hypothetical protein